VTTGLAATYPFGGVFWDYLQYPLGFQRLGHEVLYLEDTGKWCYNPVLASFQQAGECNAAYLARSISRLDSELAERWCFRDATGMTYGRPWSDVVEFCRSADLFIHISGSCWMRDEHLAAKRVIFIDTDPVYTQATLVGLSEKETQWWSHHHDRFFTFAENINSPDCSVPRGPFEWIPTRQPVVLDCFEKSVVAVKHRRRFLTTIGSWEPSKSQLEVNGIKYYGKSVEFERFLDLPRRSRLGLEFALSGAVPTERFQSYGWILADPALVSNDPWAYQHYLAQSFGEWSVAKQAYVATRSGWFSCRSACYLALGVPTIVQDTGFAHILPTGLGILPFSTYEEATEAIDQLVSDPDIHAHTARAIADEYFNSKNVLTHLIDKALN
jgi:hypothetical protein